MVEIPRTVDSAAHLMGTQDTPWRSDFARELENRLRVRVHGNKTSSKPPGPRINHIAAT
jgi:hypothetical protein